MDKLELRVDAAQCDLICYALSLASDTSASDKHKGAFLSLRNWIRYRRVRKYGEAPVEWSSITANGAEDN